MAIKKSEDEIYEEAKKRVEEKKGFLIHLAVYVLVNIFLIIIWAVTIGPKGYPWFIWPIIGWGIGIVMHCLSVFVFNRRTGWESRELEKEVQKLKREQSE